MRAVSTSIPTSDQRPQHTELLLLLQHHLSPLLLKALSERPLFPLTLRSTRVVFLLLKQFSAELDTESEVFMMHLIKIISASGEGDSNQESSGFPPRPLWMRVLSMEIMRGWARTDLPECDDD